MKHKISDLRDHLFNALEKLADKENPMEVDRAQAIAQVASVIVDSAKVELTLMRTFNLRGTGFLPEGKKRKAIPVLGEEHRFDN
jgi:hypothetical protein